MIPKIVTLSLIKQLLAEHYDVSTDAPRRTVGVSGIASSCPLARLLGKRYGCRVSVSPRKTIFEDVLVDNDSQVRFLVFLVDDTTPHSEDVTAHALYEMIGAVERGEYSVSSVISSDSH